MFGGMEGSGHGASLTSFTGVCGQVLRRGLFLLLQEGPILRAGSNAGSNAPISASVSSAVARDEDAAQSSARCGSRTCQRESRRWRRGSLNAGPYRGLVSELRGGVYSVRKVKAV